MPKIDNTIKDALRQAIEAAGSQKDFERKTGIAQQNLSRYLSGTIPTMTERTWKDIYPYLKSFLPDTYIRNISHGNIYFNQAGKVIQYTDRGSEEIERKAREQVIDEIMSMDDEVDPKVILQICKKLKKNK